MHDFVGFCVKVYNPSYTYRISVVLFFLSPLFDSIMKMNL